MNAYLARSILLAAVLAAGWPLRASAADPPSAWELWPYRVQVIVAIDEADLLPPRTKEELPALLQARVAAVVGAAWKLEVISAPDDVRQSILEDIRAVQSESLSAADEIDKLILLAVTTKDGRLCAYTRELDLTTGLWNATVTAPSPQPEYLPHAAVRAVLTAFAPLARIEKTEGQTALLKLRASGLMPPGERPLVTGGAVFRPVLMPCDAKGTVTRGQAEPIEWTYLSAKEPVGCTLECRVERALTGEIIPAYHPLRQRWALGISRSASATRLRLVIREDSGEPVEGVTVVAEENPPVVLGQSDRRGEVLVPPGAGPVRTIVARQGDNMLARLLLVPGLERELVVPVTYDRRAVELEAMLAQLADDVVDAAARRALNRQPAAGSFDSLLTRLDRLTQAVQSTPQTTRRRLEPKLTELRKGIEQLKAPPT